MPLAAAALPWLAVAGVYVEACAVRLSLGRWPQPMGSDSYSVRIELLHMGVWLLLLGSALGTPMMVIHGSLYRRYRRPLALFALGIAVLLATHHFDPGRIWEWFLD